ncbi:MAG: hypothetical protein JSV44_10100 [Candidatus Zixiibacteriota bacterium]|nr:MAG: hypothetical protein JSV44_10100 [candidate division Zixibacteria bacterium]
MCIGLFLLVVALPLHDYPLLTPTKIDLINEGMTAMLNGRWDQAYALFLNLHKIDTADPAGYLFRASVRQAEMIDREASLYGRELTHLLDSVVLQARGKMMSCSPRDSAICFLYIGHQFAYRSLWEARFGSKLAALSNGMKAKGQYQSGLRADSTLYDLYLGLGTYHYWKSVRSGILRTVGIFKNEKEKGIAEIRMALDSSLFSRDAAFSELIWIMLGEKNFDSAAVLAGHMLARFPEGNTFRWPLAESHFRSKRYGDAAREYRKIFNRVSKEPGNYYNVIEAAYWLCLALDKTGRRDQADEILDYLDSVYDDIPKDIRRKQRSKLWRLQRRGR